MKAKLIVTFLLLVGLAAAIAFGFSRNQPVSDKLHQDSAAVASASKNVASDLVSAGAHTAKEIATNATIVVTNVAAKVEVATSNIVDKAARVTSTVVGEAKSKF